MVTGDFDARVGKVPIIDPIGDKNEETLNDSKHEMRKLSLIHI